MKRLFTLLFCLVSLTAAMAQMRTVSIYVPGDGEHRGGFSLNPTFGANTMLTQFSSKLPLYQPEMAELHNNIGIGLEGFWGYDTEHGNAVEWSSITAIGARYQPFGGTALDTLGASHDVSAAAFAISLRETPSMVIPVSDQLHLGIGVDVVLEYSLNGGVRVDGTKWEKVATSDDGFETRLIGLGIHLAGVLEAKCFLSEQLYMGARLGYKFYTFNIASFLDVDESSESDDPNDRIGSVYCGAVVLDQATQQAGMLRLASSLPFQLGLEIGFRW